MNEPEIKITGRSLSVSDAVRRLNPELFGLGGLHPAERKPEIRGALDGNPSPKKASRGRMAKVGGPVIRITLVSFRRRAVADKGNASVGWKPLQDAIARFFDLDDEDGTIDWQYRQVETRGKQGSAVMIEV